MTEIKRGERLAESEVHKTQFNEVLAMLIKNSRAGQSRASANRRVNVPDAAVQVGTSGAVRRLGELLSDVVEIERA